MGESPEAMPAAENFVLDKEGWKGITGEFVATLLFVYVAVGTVVGGGTVVANAFAFGITISVLVHGFGHISGGHINPAVTLALAATKRIHWKRGVAYFFAQLLGGIVAGFMCWLLPNSSSIHTGSGCNAFDTDKTGGAFLAEVMGTFILVVTVFATIDTTRTPTDLGPLQIGFAVLIAHLVGIPQTGTGINPARSFGPALAFAALGDSDKWAASGSTGSFDGHWVYWLGPIVGSLLAAFLYDLWFGSDQNSNMQDAFKKQVAPAPAQVAPAPTPAPTATEASPETTTNIEPMP